MLGAVDDAAALQRGARAMVTVVLGEQRGDEGKGRFVDMLAESHDIVARFNGGNNAGHTVVLPDGRVLKLHSVPSGIAYPHTMNVIGGGCLVDPIKLLIEIESIRGQNITVAPSNFMLSHGAHLTLPHHISEDEIREAGAGGQGSTKSGIAQVASAKYMRTGVRAEMIIHDRQGLMAAVKQGLESTRAAREEVGLPPLDEPNIMADFEKAIDELAGFVGDTTVFVNDGLKKDKKILAEGAQAFLLDIDHGMYPYVTSSTTTSGGVAPGLGLPPQTISRVVGVIKAIQSHVGGGPFVTEINDEAMLARLHGDTTAVDAERGATTGRTRRLGYLDIPSIRRAQMVNGTTEIAITKLDWLPRFDEMIPVCVAYQHGGTALEVAPDSAPELMKSTPVYEELPNWTEDISGARTFEELPRNAQDFILFVEQKTGVPVTMIGVGPERSQVIVRK